MNNREIKFRVWDKLKKTFNISGYVWFNPSNGNACFTHNERHYGLDVTVPRFIFQQYTGLKDKNGKEIYEGDIIEIITSTKYGHEMEGVKSYLEIKFGKFNPENNILSNYIGFYCGENCSIKYYLDMNAKIVGNIFENPELLK